MPDTKIIILSGYNEFEYAKTAISIGVTDYELKPISSERLLETIKRVADIIREERAQKALLEEYERDNKESLELDKAKLFMHWQIMPCLRLKFWNGADNWD